MATEIDWAVDWMLEKLNEDGCIYQDDVVDHLLNSSKEALLKENSDGNIVLGTDILKGFRNLTEKNVVWVKPERYWRFRVPEDEEGRDARG
jgi:hypothetical protein